MKILIVDDSMTDKEIMKDILAEAGYRNVEMARSAEKAFVLLGLHNPVETQNIASLPPVDLILLDIVMPEIDGLEACKRIRAEEFLKELPIIMVTARPSDENLQIAFANGANDYITKPFNEVELLSRVRAALRLKRETDNRKAHEIELERMTETLRSFEKAVENMQIGVTITDMEGDIKYANPAESQMHGYGQDEVIGRNVRALAPKELWKPMTLRQIKEMSSRRRESVNIRKDGTVFPVWLLSDIVTDSHGKPISIVTTCEDITERRKVEEELIRSQEELEQKVQERTKEKLALQSETIRAAHLASIGELSAGVAHEINNPVNGIINCAKILADRCKGHEKEKEICEMIISEGKRVANIVQALLSFARERKEKKGPVHLDKVIADALTLTAAHMRKDGINFTVDAPDHLPVVTGHHQQIQQVFLNIINNAQYALNQKYPKEDENKSLSIAAEPLAINKDRFIRITFLDKGIGIPSHLLEKVMNPFFSTKPHDKGTGLGLSISHGIIADHGGRLSIESREGEYTRVIIDLPVGERGRT